MTQYPTIGVFTTDEPLRLEMAENGGWVVSQTYDERTIPTVIGAYTNANDMIAALAGALCRQTTEQAK
jgi:hypothetical protein